MKKVIAIILAALMIFAVTACSETKQEANVANPWTEAASLEELNEKFGGRLAQPGVMGVSGESYSYIDNDEQRIAQYKFELGGYEYTLRFSDTMTDDISGIYAGSSTIFAGAAVEANVSTSDVKASRWFTVDGQYCFVVSDGGKMDASNFSDIADEIAALTIPEESKGDEITAADLAGSYQDSFSGRACMDVTEENGTLNGLVSWGNGASDTVTWSMTLKLEDGKLTYTDCICEEHIWDEKDNETVEVLFKNEAGYFEISEEGNLLWTGSSEESCKECCFEKDIL